MKHLDQYLPKKNEIGEYVPSLCFVHEYVVIQTHDVEGN